MSLINKNKELIEESELKKESEEEGQVLQYNKK